MHSSCQKLLFSATLTTDPGKIASLGLRDPKYFVVRETSVGSHHAVPGNFSMPIKLTVGSPSLMPEDRSKAVCKGTHDRMRPFPETPSALLSRARSSSRQRIGIHEIGRIYRASRQAFRAV